MEQKSSFLFDDEVCTIPKSQFFIFDGYSQVLFSICVVMSRLEALVCFVVVAKIISNNVRYYYSQKMLKKYPHQFGVRGDNN